MAQLNLDSTLAQGRDAVRRHAWLEGFELISAADRMGNLEADDLEALAQAAWWNGRADVCITAGERAYTLHVDADRPRRAALTALGLAKDHFGLGSSAIGSAWLNKAQRLLENQPIGVEHGYLARLQAVIALEGEGEFELALERSRQVLEIATRFKERDLIALGLHDQGRTLVAKGQVKEGMALLDEATVAALSGELLPITTGIIYCNLIGVCEQTADFRRAAEWTDAARRWCDRMAIAGFPGMCRVHRAEVVRLRGAWQEAELEARRAFDELREFNVGYAAEAKYLIGETRLRRGDVEEAKEAFGQAHELGRDPNPGLALLFLHEGKLEAAAATIRRALNAERRPLVRARLLPAQVAIAQAAGDRATAEVATNELDETAMTYGTAAFKAEALEAKGVLALMGGDADAAVRPFCEALVLWRQVDAPYEEAQARVLLASAYRAGGDVGGAVMELRAALAALSRLGAVPGERQVQQRLAELGEGEEPGKPSDSATRTFVFTDIVRSTALVEAMGDEAWAEVLRWHDHTLRRLIAEQGGEEVKHVGDGIFASFDRPDQAIDCAVQIQRALADHRRDHGFAPQVRIGVHRTVAAKHGLDYRGKGVHEAARIAELAQANEILASWQTAQPCKFGVSSPRPLAVKGIAEPIQVVTVAWH